MAVDPLWGSVVLQLDCNGTNGSTTFTDLSDSAHVVTANGSMAVSTAYPKFGTGAASGAGAGSLTVASSPDFTFGTGNFRLRAWVCFMSTTGNQAVYSLGSNWTLYLGSGTLYLFDGSSNIMTAAITTTEYHWIDLVRLNGVLHLLIDNTEVASFTYTTNMTSSNFVIADNTAGNAKLTGYMDDIQVMKGDVGPLLLGHPLGPLLTGTEPPPIYVYDPNKPLAALLLNPIGYQGAVTVTDQAVVPETLTAVGNARLSVNQSKFTVASLYCDGAGDYFQLPADTKRQLTADLTLGAWVRPISDSQARATIMANAMTSWAAGAVYLLRYGTSGAHPGKVALGRHGTDPLLVSTTTLALNTWAYVEVNRNGSTMELSVNGTVEATATDSGTWDFSTLGTLFGANLWDGADGYFYGFLGPMRIIKGGADHSGNFTAPTDAFTTNYGAISGVVKDSADDFTETRVRVYREETGELVGAALSDAVTGYYEIPTPFIDEHSAVVYPSATDPSVVTLQAQVFNGVIAAVP